MKAPNSKRLAPPPASSHPVDVGLRPEATILAEMVRRGYQVLVPFGTNQRYDLVLDMNGEFVRAQCKKGRLRNGVIRFPARSTRANRQGIYFRGYSGQVEIFLVHCPETNQIYAVPVDEVPATDGWLRVDPTRNGQQERIRWARDYELPG
jgi:hypothetical protein